MSKKTKGESFESVLAGNCFDCDNCQYIGEGDHICDVHHVGVICEWEPTDEFYHCGGKDFVEK